MKRPVRRYWGTPRDGVVSPRRRPEGLLARTRRALRLALLVTVFAASLWGADRVLAWLTSSPVFAVRSVHVAGARHAPVEALRSEADVLGRNVFTLDLGAARERLVAHPWVADATVRRLVPDAVRVAIEEAEPVAWHVRDDGFALLADGGEVLEVVGGADELARFDVPRLELEEGAGGARLATATQTLAALRRDLPDWARTLTRVTAAHDRITVEAVGQPPVHLGGPDSVDELSGWLVHRAALGRDVGELRAVDARWSGRLFLQPERIR